MLGTLHQWYSSVLLFAVPTSPLAQPWNVIVGNTLAGIIGVACAQWIPDLTTALAWLWVLPYF